jgi:hypothetical protein
MKTLFYACALLILIPLFSFAQSTIQTGYAVITPTSGSGAGLTVTEVFSEQVDGNLFQASVIGSPLVTLTNIVVNSDPATGLNTGIAMVNPNNVPAVVTLTLGNQAGVSTATTTITLGGGQQISRFVSEFFSGSAVAAAPMRGLLFISSTVPISVLGLAFSGFSFTSLPPATQITAVNVTNTTNAAVITNNSAVVATTVPVGVLNGIAAVQAPPIPTTITQIPSTFPGLVTSQSAVGITSPLTGIAPLTAVTPLSGITPLTGIVPTTATSTGQLTLTGTPTTIGVVSPSVIVFPQIQVGIGGAGAQILPQVVAGGGWLSQITIANTSGVSQVVRVDFFNNLGAPFPLPFGSSVPSIIIAPGGIATISTL